MKVYFGPYRTWFGIYQLCDKILFWKKRPLRPWEKGYDFKIDSQAEDERHEFCNKYIVDTWFGKLWNRVANWYTTTKIDYVKIDDHDVWGLDHTLAKIIYPALIRLKDAKRGAPVIDDEDVPEHLRSTAATPLTDEQKIQGTTDDLWFKRWDWIMDEMIWAFEQMAKDDKDCPDWGVDGKEYEAYHERINNATYLFGKYYRNLWD